MGFRKGSLFKQASLDLSQRHFLITVDDDAPHLHLLFLVDDDIDDHMILLCDIFTLHDLNLCILESFVIKVLFGKDFRTVERIGVSTHTLQQTEFLFHVLTLRLLQSYVVDGRDTWTGGECDVQVNLVTYQ